MPIGLVKYINALPFALPLSATPLVLAAPTELSSLLKTGALNCALTSSVSSFEKGFRALPHFGIAAKKQVLSVNLYTNKPLNQISSIALTEDSATSVALLKILCHKFWKISPKFTKLKGEKKEDAFLLIGDVALQKKTIEGYQTLDLAHTWYTYTELPFVFALFVVKESLDTHLIEKKLDDALNWSEKNHKKVIDAALKKSALTKECIAQYYQQLHYRLDTEEEKSLTLFQNYLSDVPKI